MLGAPTVPTVPTTTAPSTTSTSAPSITTPPISTTTIWRAEPEEDDQSEKGYEADDDQE